MGNANRESLGFIKEVTDGTNPGGNKKLINFLTNNLAKRNQTQMSNNVRADTNRTGVVRTGIEVGGEIPFELQYGAYDNFFEGVLRNSFSTALNVSDDTAISAANADNSFNGTSKFGNAVVGQYIKVSGFAEAANNGYFKILTASANKITVAGGTLTDESAGEEVTIKGALCKNGTTESSFTIERHFQDLSTQTYNIFTGMKVNELSLNLATADLANGSFSFIGKNAIIGTSSGFSGSTAAETTETMNTVENIKQVFVDNTASTFDITGFDFSISTNANSRRVIGQLETASVDQKSISVTGTMNVYMEDKALIDNLYDFDTVSLAVVIEDAAGNGYVVDIPSVKFTEGAPDNPGIDGDIEIPVSFEAFYNSDLDATLGLSRFPA